MKEKTDCSQQLYHCQLFPDWHTSYLWYDPDAPNYHDDPVVEDYTLDARYPGLAPLYWAWQDVSEESFEKQGVHQGYDTDVFPDPNERVSWEVAGFLIVSWLILQDNVESIEYTPSEVDTYFIKNDNLGEVMRQFLEDENASLNHDISH